MIEKRWNGTKWEIVGSSGYNVGVLPVGAIQPFAMDTAPTGWLKCDGSAVSRTTYKTLFDAIGTKYGSGDGSTTFNLPNFTDKVLYGSATAGTAIGEELPNIKGTFGGKAGSQTTEKSRIMFGRASTSGAFSNITTGYGGIYYSEDLSVGNTDTNWAPGINFSANGSSSVYKDGGKVKVAGVTVIYCIKYQSSVDKLSVGQAFKNVGDVVETLDATATITTMAERYGGTWTAISDRYEMDDDVTLSFTFDAGTTGTVADNVWTMHLLPNGDGMINFGLRFNNCAMSTTAEVKLAENMKLNGVSLQGGILTDITNRSYATVETTNLVNAAVVYFAGSGRLWAANYGKGGTINVSFGGTVLMQDAKTKLSITPDRVFKRFKRTA